MRVAYGDFSPQVICTEAHFSLPCHYSKSCVLHCLLLTNIGSIYGGIGAGWTGVIIYRSYGGGGLFDTLTDQRFHPLELFYDIYFRRTNPKIFLMAPIYTYFDVERAPKKRNFFLFKIFQNVPEIAFLTVFILRAAQLVWS